MNNQLPGTQCKNVDRENQRFENNQIWSQTIDTAFVEVPINAYLGFTLICDKVCEFKLNNDQNNAIPVDQTGTFYFENRTGLIIIRGIAARTTITIISNIDLTQQRNCELLKAILDKIQTLPETFEITGSVDVNNFPATQPVSGSVDVNNFPATQPVSGSVDVNNFPATQPVSGTVDVGNFPATQPVSGSVDVNNFPATQPVSGTVTVSGITENLFEFLTDTPLAGGGVYSKTWTAQGKYQTMSMFIYSDKSTNANAVVLSYYNGAQLLGTDLNTYLNGSGFTQYEIPMRTEKIILTYTNGATAQTVFYLAVRFNVNNINVI